MGSFTLYWKNGKHEIVDGADVVDAMRNAGYSDSAIHNLSFFLRGRDRAFRWRKDTLTWEWTYTYKK